VNFCVGHDAQTVHETTTLIRDQEGGGQSAPIGSVSDNGYQYFLDHFCRLLQKP
jgi:hypothetical protein